MIQSPTLHTAVTSLLATLIEESFADTQAGHCARIDYIQRDEALRVCAEVNRRNQSRPRSECIGVYTLTDISDDDQSPHAIQADAAIELRNRKKERVCLCVPADYMDATISSLGNSFASLDGRYLYQQVYNRLKTQLSPATHESVGRIERELRGKARVSIEDRIDLLGAALQREHDDTIDELGMDLWRVGLIADSRPTFDRYLQDNRRYAALLAHPRRLSASFRERIASLKAHPDTVRALEAFFARRHMSTTKDWSHALAQGEGLTFDQWIFPKLQHSDLTNVSVTPYLDSNKMLLKPGTLQQTDGPGGYLIASCGEKAMLRVRWTTDPLKPTNVHRWRVALVLAGDADQVGWIDDDEPTSDLPSKAVKGSSRTTQLKLDLELEQLPEDPYCVRVVALDQAGNEQEDAQGHPLASHSEEFYLKNRPVQRTSTPTRRRTSPSLPYGRLDVLMQIKDPAVTINQQTSSEQDGVQYYVARMNNRFDIAVTTSVLLHNIENRTLREPNTGGRYRLRMDDIGLATLDMFEAHPLHIADSGTWASFWKARAAFFKAVHSSPTHQSILVADWLEIDDSALKYAQEYQKLLDALLASNSADRDEHLRAALSIDSVHVTIDAHSEEQALLILPTHPLRVAWFAGYAALLGRWETEIANDTVALRSTRIDRALLKEVRPANIPAFCYTGDDTQPLFLFFQNLSFHYAIALPPAVRDPYRRFRDVATVLGLSDDQENMLESRSERLTQRLRDFQQAHPYAQPLTISLINPDHGEFFAQAVKKLVTVDSDSDDHDAVTLPTFAITAYIDHNIHADMKGLHTIRSAQKEAKTRTEMDYLQPGLSVTNRPLSDLQTGHSAEAHLTLVSDLSTPVIQLSPLDIDDDQSTSLSLYGLIARMIGQFSSSDGVARWRYRIATTRPTQADSHPAGERYSNALIMLQRVHLQANGELVRARFPSAPVPSTTVPLMPSLDVELSSANQTILENVHAHSDWVVTNDRFFSVDYYDSPRDSTLGDLAQKYLIDHTPDFVDGIGHRMMVTTTWRAEVDMILRRAMIDLGMASVDHSVGNIMHYLKMVSGRLALQTMDPTTSGIAAASLGILAAWLQSKKRLSQGFLVPVDMHRSLFWPSLGELRRCDLILFSLRRGIVDATFIEVKWRRGPLGETIDLERDMMMQMLASTRSVEQRFFSPDRPDGALQRAHLASILSYYCDRAQRYELLEAQKASQFREHIRQLAREGLSFRPSCEGYIISLESAPRPRRLRENASVTMITASDLGQIASPLDDRAGSRTGATLNTTSVFTVSTHTPQPLSKQDGEADQNAREGVSSSHLQMPSDAASMDRPHIAESMPETVLNPPVAPIEAEAGSASTASAGADSTGAERPTLSSSINDDSLTGEPPVNVVVGTAGANNIVWRPALAGSPHLFMTGIPGQGKSWTTIHLLTQLHQQGVPALVFDFHGQFSSDTNMYRQQAQPRVIDASKGLPFSPFECSNDNGPFGWEATASTIADIFAYVCDLGVMQKDALLMSLRDEYRAKGYGSSANGEPRYPSLASVRARLERKERSSKTSHVVARCRSLLEMNLFQPPEDGQGTLAESIQQGMIVDLHAMVSETLQQATGAFLLRKLYRDMFLWGHATAVRLAIVLDEAHRLSRDITLPKIMKEGRKFGVVVIVASQGLRDFQSDVLANAGTKIAFRANSSESRKIAGYFNGPPGVDIKQLLEGLQVGSALVQTPEMKVCLHVAMA